MLNFHSVCLLYDHEIQLSGFYYFYLKQLFLNYKHSVQKSCKILIDSFASPIIYAYFYDIFTAHIILPQESIL